MATASNIILIMPKKHCSTLFLNKLSLNGCTKVVDKVEQIFK